MILADAGKTSRYKGLVMSLGLSMSGTCISPFWLASVRPGMVYLVGCEFGTGICNAVRRKLAVRSGLKKGTGAEMERTFEHDEIRFSKLRRYHCFKFRQLATGVLIASVGCDE
jgi:hypothetical protein